MSYSKSSKLLLFTSIIAAIAAVICQPEPTSAAKATDFNAGNIISDAIFYDKDAMTLAQIEAFINSKTIACDTWGVKPVGSGRTINGVAVNPNTTRAKYAEMMKAAGNSRYHQPPYICLTNYYENPATRQTSFDTNATKVDGMLSAAEIIYKAAQTYNINPQVLLVTLKKEYGHVYTDDWPLRDQYNTVMGYACPDSGAGNTANCDSKYYGFYNQVMNAAWQFNYYKQNITKYNYQPYRTNIIQYSPTSSCGSKQVYIENIATASLYIYTPYTPNDAALAAYPGTANCGAYGNRNFFMFFNEWFGSTHYTPAKASPAAGDFFIVPKSNYEKTIQLAANNAENGTGIILNTRVQNTLDSFRLVKNSDDTYTILNISTNKAIDVPYGAANEGTAVSQCESNGTDAQKWHIYDNGNGSYSIASALNSTLVLAISDTGAIKLSAYTKDPMQSFRFIPTTQPIADGTYTVESKLRTDFVLDIANGHITDGSKIHMYDQNYTPAQTFQLSYDPTTGYYTMLNPNSNKVIDVAAGSIADGAKIQIFTSNNTCAQQWIIEKWADNDFEILSACSNKAIDIMHGNSANGATVQLFTPNHTPAQKWTFEAIDQNQPPVPTQPIPNGLYNIHSTLRPNYVLDVAGGGTLDGTNIWMYDQNHTPAQVFSLTYDAATNTYTIINPQSNKVIDVAYGGTKNYSNVWIYTSNSTCAQQWRITPTASGSYEIASTCSGLLLDVIYGGTLRETNVHIVEKNDTPAQKWTFVPIN